MRKGFFLTIIAVLLFSSNVYAGGSSSSSSKPLDGSYPIVLIHGILGFDDTDGLLGGMARYWGGLDDYLRGQWSNNNVNAYCSRVLTPGTTAMSHTTQRAGETALLVNQWMAACGYSKVHLFGHSQGGLVSRWMASNITSINSKIASVTTINSVHKGAPVADIVLNVAPGWLKTFISGIASIFGGKLYGDQNGDGVIDDQNVIDMGESLTVSYMTGTFNRTAPNKSGVKYYSYGSKMALADPIQHPIMALTHPATWAGGLYYGLGGANDGIVPLESQKWGTWKGEPDQPLMWGLLFTTGIDHLQATKLQLVGVVNGTYDEEGYYLKMAKNAKSSQ